MEVSRKYSVIIFLLCGLLAGCFSVYSDKAGDASVEGNAVYVSWTANHEKAVNSAGGGYRVYYSTDPTFGISNAPFIDVPYVSGSGTPNSVKFPLSGTYYVKIVAYSAFGTSSPSSQIAVVVP